MSKWTDIVATVAPTIASAIGTPLAGVAVGVLSSVLGLSDSSEESVANAISGAKPEDLLKIKQADLDFKLQIEKLGVDLEKIASDDRNSARNRQIQLNDRTLPFLAISVTLGFFGLLSFLCKFDVPVSNKDILNIMLGSLGTAWISIVAYYFGSSSSSARKDSLIAGK